MRAYVAFGIAALVAAVFYFFSDNRPGAMPEPVEAPAPAVEPEREAREPVLDAPAWTERLFDPMRCDLFQAFC